MPKKSARRGTRGQGRGGTWTRPVLPSHSQTHPDEPTSASLSTTTPYFDDSNPNSVDAEPSNATEPESMADQEPTRATEATAPVDPAPPEQVNEQERRDTDDADIDPAILGGDNTQANASSSTIQDDSTQQSGAGQAQGPTAMDTNAEEGRMPARKDANLRELLSKMDNYTPVIPDAVVFHALTLAGLKPPPLSSLNSQTSQSTTSDANNGTTAGPSTATASRPSNGTTAGPAAAPEVDDDTTPLPLVRLISLICQKYVSDIAADAYQYSRMRSGTLTSNTLSAMSNPGAPGPSGPSGGAGGTTTANTGAGATGGASGATASGGAGAAGSAANKNAAGQHVLGVQRAGFGGGGQGGGQNRTVLTMEDLGMAVGEYGVNVKRPEFYR